MCKDECIQEEYDDGSGNKIKYDDGMCDFVSFISMKLCCLCHKPGCNN